MIRFLLDTNREIQAPANLENLVHKVETLEVLQKYTLKLLTVMSNIQSESLVSPDKASAYRDSIHQAVKAAETLSDRSDRKRCLSHPFEDDNKEHISLEAEVFRIHRIRRFFYSSCNFVTRSNPS